MTGLPGQHAQASPRSHRLQAALRAQAAALLREARRRSRLGLGADEPAQWAASILPDSPPAQRLRIDCLLRAGDAESAATATAAALRRHPHDWKLLLRQARALLASGGGRPEEADLAVDRALDVRPASPAALALSAEIAAHRGHHARALHLLGRLDAARPGRRAIVERLVETLLELDRADEACVIIEQRADIGPAIAARVLIAQRRFADARALLEQASEACVDAHDRRALRSQLAGLLQQLGDWPALRAMRETADQAAAVIALARGALASGAFERAERLAGDVAGEEAHAAREILLVCAAARGDHQAAAEHHDALHAGHQPRDRAREAATWLQCLLGSVIAEHVDPRRTRSAGGDPGASVLDGLLHEVISTFDRALEAPDVAASPHALARWRHWREACEAALQPPAPLATAPGAAEETQPQRLAA